MSIDMSHVKLLLDVVTGCAAVGPSVSNISQMAGAELAGLEAKATAENAKAREEAAAKAAEAKAKADAEAKAKAEAYEKEQAAATKKLEAAPSVTYTSDNPERKV